MSRASTLPLITFSYEPFSPLFSRAVLRPFFPEPTQLPRLPVTRQRLPLSSVSLSPFARPNPSTPPAFLVRWKNALIRFCRSSLLAKGTPAAGGEVGRETDTTGVEG